MAGVKGKSGGARPNSGGKRAGAGRKPKVRPADEKSANPPPAADPTQPEVDGSTLDNLQWLEAVRKGLIQASNLQVRAAIAAVQYTHTKRHDGGKKEEQAGKAKEAAGGKFAPKAPPKLVVSNG